MKDLDELLSKYPPKPKRPLSADFTQVVAAKVQEPRPSVWQKVGNIFARPLAKAGIASFAGIVLLGGTVTAVTLWLRPEVTPTITQQLPSGNRIVGYDVRNCKLRALDGTEIKPSAEKVYYEVREGSTLTDEQIQDSLRALCEERASSNTVSTIIKKLPQDLPGIFSTVTYTIDAITENGITLSPDKHYRGLGKLPALTTEPNLTYTRFADDLLVYDQDYKTKIAFSDLKAGDSVKLIMQDTSGRSTETPEAYNPLNHPENIIILVIIKVPPLSGDPIVLDQAFGSDLVRLEPCDSSSTGFCRVYEFGNH